MTVKNIDKGGEKHGSKNIKDTLETKNETGILSRFYGHLLER